MGIICDLPFSIAVGRACFLPPHLSRSVVTAATSRVSYYIRRRRSTCRVLARDGKSNLYAYEYTYTSELYTMGFESMI